MKFEFIKLNSQLVIFINYSTNMRKEINYFLELRFCNCRNQFLSIYFVFFNGMELKNGSKEEKNKSFANTISLKIVLVGNLINFSIHQDETTP